MRAVCVHVSLSLSVAEMVAGWRNTLPFGCGVSPNVGAVYSTVSGIVGVAQRGKTGAAHWGVSCYVVVQSAAWPLPDARPRCVCVAESRAPYQASLSLALLVTAYVVQQRERPYVATSGLSNSLQVRVQPWWRLLVACLRGDLKGGGGLGLEASLESPWFIGWG